MPDTQIAEGCALRYVLPIASSRVKASTFAAPPSLLEPIVKRPPHGTACAKCRLRMTAP